MSLEHILLGMLREPATGYALGQEFSAGARHFWSAELSQIYPALQRMERSGWLKSQRQSSPVGPARRVYRRTAAGTRELIAWLQSPPAVGAERFAYLGQLIFMGELDDLARTADFLTQLRKQLAATLEFLSGIAEPLEQQLNDDPAAVSGIQFHELLAARMGVRSLRAKVSWCDESLQMIENRQNRRPIHA